MRRKKNKPFRKQILKETEMDKISGTDITEKLYQRHPDLEQLWYFFCNLQHSAPCWIQRRPQHTGSHQKLKVMSTFMYIILSIYPLFAHLFLPFKEVYHSPLHLLHIIFWDFDLGFSFLNVWIFVLSFFFSAMWHNMWYPSLLTSDRIHAPCIGSAESYPLDCQGSPHHCSSLGAVSVSRFENPLCSLRHIWGKKPSNCSGSHQQT